MRRYGPAQAHSAGIRLRFMHDHADGRSFVLLPRSEARHHIGLQHVRRAPRACHGIPHDIQGVAHSPPCEARARLGGTACVLGKASLVLGSCGRQLSTGTP